MNNKDRMDILERHLVSLREHFNSVHILAVRQSDDDPDDTVSFSIGRGSFYERFGLIRETLLKKDEKDRIEVRRHMEEGDD